MYLKLLEKHLKDGALTLHLPTGETRAVGAGRPLVDWHLHKPGTLGRIIRNPELNLGETYMDGEWSAGEGQLPALLGLLMRNNAEPQDNWLQRQLVRLLGPLRTWNPVRRSYRNVARHYDLDEWLFRQFLDQDMHYSCAYFPEPDISLEEAQRAKCRHLRNKLRLHSGQRVLDIGSGWGSLGMYLAERSDVRVTGLTLSREQLQSANRRARERGLKGAVQFKLEDYREHRGRYDRVVSVGMFEHVGRAHYRPFFDKVRDLLSEDGVAVIHTIGRTSPDAGVNPWIHRHIFPGGYIPSLSEIMRAVEGSGLIAADVEVLRLHYAYTLAAWQARFQKVRPRVAQRMGERFCRMWEFYLASCENAFRWRDLVVFQVQVSRRLKAVPITRSYLYRSSEQAPPEVNAALRSYTFDRHHPTRDPD